MAIEYTEFGPEQQEATLRSRIAAWEADHFSHEINKQAFLALPDGPEKTRGLQQSETAQATLESSIKSAKSHMAKLKAAKPTTPATPPAGQA